MQSEFFNPDCMLILIYIILYNSLCEREKVSKRKGEKINVE